MNSLSILRFGFALKLATVYGWNLHLYLYLTLKFVGYVGAYQSPVGEGGGVEMMSFATSQRYLISQPALISIECSRQA